MGKGREPEVILKALPRPQSKDLGVTCCRSHRPNAGSVGRHDECVAICKRTT